MSILTTPSGAFSTSLIYITVGTLIDIWTVVSLVYYPPSTSWGHFLVVGFLATGIALLVIGLLLVLEQANSPWFGEVKSWKNSKLLAFRGV